MLDFDNATKLLPYEFTKDNNILAFQTDDSIEVIHCDEIDITLYNELRRFFGSSFSFTKLSHSEFNELLTSNYAIENNDANDISEELDDSFDLEEFAGSINATEDLLSGSNDAPIIKLINGIISKAIKSRASDIHFEPYEDQLIVRYRVDGIMQQVLSQESKLSSVLISRIKIMSGLDISERRLPQDGRVSLSLGDKSIDVRVSTLPSSYGERIVLRILDKNTSQINIGDLGFPNSILDSYKAALKTSESFLLFN